MSEKTEITFMQTRLIRLASEEWHLPVEQIIHLFKEADVLGYIEKCYGIFHCEGDEAVLEDITEFLEWKENSCDEIKIMDNNKEQVCIRNLMNSKTYLFFMKSLSYNCSSCDILNIIERKGGTTYANVRSHIKKTTGQCLDKR